MEKRSNAGFGAGGVSILLIFVLLCLTTFATLSLVSANADLKLTKKNAQAVEDYYEANNQAATLLMQINEQLLTLPEGIQGQSLALEVEKVLPIQNERVEFAVEGQTVAIRYSFPMGDTRELDVSLEVLPETAEGKRYRLLAWQTVSTAEWTENNSVQLWDGNAGGLPQGMQ